MSVSTTIVPVIVGALGRIRKWTDKHIKKMLGRESVYEIEKKIALGRTAYLLKRILSKGD